MTTRMQFITTDDRDEHDSAGKVLNDIGDDGEKIIISIGGTVKELDLTAKNAARLREDMRPWLAAGHEPGQQPQPPEAQAAPDGRTGQGRRREIPGTRDFYRELREWAGASGMEVPTAGRSDKKRNYVYTTLTAPYVRWLEARAAEGRDGGVAAARLAMARQLGLTAGVSAGTQDAPG